MIEHFLPQTLLLLGTAVGAVLLFQRLRVPSSLGYLLVGILLSSYTPGPVIEAQPLRALAEFGIVFLLFTIGLNFTIPQIQALRNTVLTLGTGQVAGTTAVIALAAWLLGLPGAAAFVVGAVFAQSSTTVISKQLAEQAEEHSRHGRLGVAMSVFQDVTAVPFVVIIPVLGAAGGAGAWAMAGALGWAFAKAGLAFLLVYLAGRWVLGRLFYLVAEQRSAEVFTLTVLFVSLIAAWTTNSLGLSLAFGGFLAGMMLGETAFRHQVEAAIRPFRDVLLGLFFIGIGMLFDPSSLPQIWHWALLGAVALLAVKTALVAALVRLSGLDPLTAWRTGLLLAVGGEFGFALLAIALDVGALEAQLGQIVLTSVLFSIVIAPFLIRYNHAIAHRLTPQQPAGVETPPVRATDHAPVDTLRDHVIICGFGRIGQSVARSLDQEGVPYVAVDLDVSRVRSAQIAGERVYYGDTAEHDILDSIGLADARLLVISHEDTGAALKTLQYARALRPNLPIMVRTRDETHVDTLRAAGATEVVPETLEASLMIAAHALVLLDVPIIRVLRRLQEQRESHYQVLRGFIGGRTLYTNDIWGEEARRLQPIYIDTDSPAVGQNLQNLQLADVTITALVRNGQRHLAPAEDTCFQAGDVVVLSGTPKELKRAEQLMQS